MLHKRIFRLAPWNIELYLKHSIHVHEYLKRSVSIAVYCKLVMDRTTATANTLQPHNISPSQSLDCILLHFWQSQQPHLGTKQDCCGCEGEKVLNYYLVTLRTNLPGVIDRGYVCIVLLLRYSVSVTCSYMLHKHWIFAIV